MVLEKDGEDQLDRSCEKQRSITYSQGGHGYPMDYKKEETNWICHILRRNCLLKHVTEGKIE
jgi:hypothetical protein